MAKLLSMQKEIPVLGSLPSGVALKDGVVVRMRGMIQDTLDGVIKHQKYGDYDLRFRQGLEDIVSSENLAFSDTYYDVDRYTIVSVPGVSAPAMNVLSNSVISADQPAEKPVVAPSIEPLSDDPPALIPLEPSLQAISSTDSASPHPIACSENFSVVAHVTRDSSEPMTEYKLHQVVDIVGIVSKYVPEDSTSLPLVDYTLEVISIATADSSDQTDGIVEEPKTSRSVTLNCITNLLNGDELSAEYLLLQLISNRYDNPVLPTLGSWCLNLSNSASIDLPALQSFLSQVYGNPLVVIACSNANLMNRKFYPERINTNEFTSPGMLQLPKKTLLVLDERVLNEGNVNSLNVLTVNKVIRDHELMGLFGTTMVDFPLELRSLIFTKQGPSLFSAPEPARGINGTVPFAHLPVKCEGAQTKETITPKEAEIVREYIKHCQNLIKKVNIPEAVVEQFENDWVLCRKYEDNIPTDDIHIWATLLRSMSASYGCEEASLEDGKAVMKLETLRRSRILEIAEKDKTARSTVTGA